MVQIDPQLQGTSGFSAKSWEYAAAFADSLGALPASVTSLIRFLLIDFENDPHVIGQDSKFLISRFFKSRSFQAPYFNAVSMFRPERLDPPDEPFTTRDFIESFSAPEHALLTGMIFLHRQARKLSDEALFETATSWLQRGVNVGWLIGKALNPVGPANGLLVGSYKWLGILPFLRHDPEGFKLYARHLRSKDFSRTDIDFEHDRWECTSSQVGIMLLQRMGFGTARLIPLMRATTTISAASTADPIERGFRAAEVWISYLLESRTVPSIPLPPAYYLTPQDLDQISSRLTDKTSKNHRGWLSATKQSISLTTTPQLFPPKNGAKNDTREVLPGVDQMDETPSPEVLAHLEHAEEVDSILE